MLQRQRVPVPAYCTATKPLTVALDILQADCPYGTLLPTLEVLMQRTLTVKDALSSMTAGLPDAIVVWSTLKLVEIYSTTLLLNMEQNIHYNCKTRLKMQMPVNNKTELDHGSYIRYVLQVIQCHF